MDITRPSKPRIISQLAATVQAQRWTETHAAEWIDYHGWHWILDESTSELPIAGNSKELEIRVRLQLRTTATAADSVGARILDSEVDERMIGLLGEDRVVFLMKPITVLAVGEEQLKKKLAEAKQQLREKIQSPGLTAIKRRLLGNWLERQSRFGGRL